MGRVLAFTNSKGGVGKSTLSVHLAVWLFEQGKRVALADADAQGSSSTWLREASPELPVYRLQTADEVLEQIPALRKQFDFVVVDGPAGLSEVTRAILFVTDVSFMPCGPSALDLRAGNDSIRVIRQVQAILKGPPEVVLVPNKLQRRYRLSRQLLETARQLGVDIVSGLRLLQAYADAPGQGKVVWHVDGGDTDAAREMMSLLEEMVNYGSSTKVIDTGVANL